MSDNAHPAPPSGDSTARLIFQAATFISDRQQRQEFLGVACLGDGALRRRVEALLSAADDGGSFMRLPAVRLVEEPSGACDHAVRAHPGEAAEPLSNPQGQPRMVGRYQLLEILGSGAHGTVYKARDPELDRIVAIKIPRHTESFSEAGAERLLREARSVARLRHPCIVSIHEVGMSSGFPYLVSEYVDGATLANVMASRRMAPRELAELVAAVAEALHYAHELGVIHRDVKPSNILLDQLGTPRVTDFGLAKRDAGETTITIEGQVLGTPAYMSPEQAVGDSRKVDRRSDLYSLGVTLYELLTGELPFRGATGAMLQQALYDEPRPPRSVCRNTPRDLETICLKAMSKEASQRYASGRQMADDLRRFLRSEPIHARPIGPAERAWRWCRRKPALAMLLSVVVVLLGAIVLGGTAIVGLLLAALTVVSGLSAVQYRRQAEVEKRLRIESDENLYYHRIARSHRDLTAALPQIARAEELLDGCSPAHRHWEWDYLNRLARADDTVLRAQGSEEFRGVAFSADGNQLAAACGDGAIRIWDLRTRQHATLRGHGAYVYSVACDSAARPRLASSGNDGCVRVWDPQLGRETLDAPLPGLKVYAVGMANCVAFSSDGKLLAAASDADAVRIWDAATGKAIRRLEGHELHASCVAFSGDGRLLATGSWQGVVRVWDVPTGKLLYKLALPEHCYPVASLSFSPGPNVQLLAAGYFDSRVDVWNVTRCEVACRLRGHIGFITSVAFHPWDDRRLATAGEDRIVRIWDVPSGRAVLQLEGHVDICSGLAFSPDGMRLASASYDRTVRVWEARLAERRQELHTLHCTQEIRSVAISPGGEMIASAGDGSDVELFNAVTGQRLDPLEHAFSNVVFSLAFSADEQRMVAAGFDDGSPACVLKVLHLASGRTLFEHREHQEIFAVAMSPCGGLVAFGLGDGTVNLVELATAKVAFVGRHDRPIAYGSVRFRSDGRRLASASLDGTARIWDLASPLQELQERSAAAAPRSGGNLLCRMTSDEFHIAFWSVAYSPDERRLLTGDKNGRLRLWDAETGARIEERCETIGGAFISADFSPDGRWIVSASEDCTARVYDAETLELVRRFRGHRAPIHCLAVSNDLLVTGGRDKAVKVWSLK